MSSCGDCGRELQAPAMRCGCGWRASTARSTAPRPQWPSLEESKAAYDRVRDKLNVRPTSWTRTDFVAHYQRLQTDPAAPPYSRQFARDALRAMGIGSDAPERPSVEAELAAMRQAMQPFERVPGEDDSGPTDAARTQPAAPTQAGEVSKPPIEWEDSFASLPDDDLEREFRSAP